MRRCLAIWMVLFACKSYSQNIIANGGFEDRNICIEFNSACAPEGWFKLPLTKLNVTTMTGERNHFISITMENVLKPFVARNYYYTRLLCPLEAGRKYRFRVAVITTEDAFDHLDVLMVPYEPNRNRKLLDNEKDQLHIAPQHETGVTKGSWRGYAIDFTAKGDERYLVIGNFSKARLSTKQDIPAPGDVIYDIDDVSLLAGDGSSLTCPEAADNKAILYRNNLRHTPDNFLDDEPPYVPVSPKTTEPAKTEITQVVNDTLIVPDVLFKTNSAVINPVFIKKLDTLINNIRSRDFKRIEVTGHTDSIGTRALNEALSLQRAETVSNYIMQKLRFPYANISAAGKADLEPVSSNSTAEGRRRNRRVEVVLIR